LQIAAEAYEHLEFLPRNNSIYAQLLEVLAETKELDGGFKTGSLSMFAHPLIGTCQSYS